MATIYAIVIDAYSEKKKDTNEEQQAKKSHSYLVFFFGGKLYSNNSRSTTSERMHHRRVSIAASVQHRLLVGCTVVLFVGECGGPINDGRPSTDRRCCIEKRSRRRGSVEYSVRASKATSSSSSTYIGQ